MKKRTYRQIIDELKIALGKADYRAMTAEGKLRLLQMAASKPQAQKAENVNDKPVEYRHSTWVQDVAPTIKNNKKVI